LPPADGDATTSATSAEAVDAGSTNTSATTDQSSAQSDTASSPGATQGDTASSPGAADQGTSDRDGLLAAVRDAVAPPAAKDVSTNVDTKAAAPGSTGKTLAPDSLNADGTARADPLDSDPTEAELAAATPHVAGRIKRLLAQRLEARTALEAVQPELDQHRQLMGYLQQHQLAVDDVNLLLGVGAALRRGDYADFLRGIEPYRDMALQALGQTVAPDLLAQVESGAMTEDAARQLTKTRMEAARHRVEAEQSQQRHTERDTQALAQQVHGAIAQWETTVRQRDPDYALKEAQVRRTSQALIAEFGRPTTPAAAIEMAQRAYDEVTQEFARLVKPPVPTRQTPNGVSQRSTTATAVPRSLMDAVNLGIERTNRRAV
jgi:hypothetical protein